MKLYLYTKEHFVAGCIGLTVPILLKVITSFFILNLH